MILLMVVAGETEVYETYELRLLEEHMELVEDVEDERRKVRREEGKREEIELKREERMMTFCLVIVEEMCK